MKNKLVDSELKVMNIIWDEKEATAKHISDILNQKYGITEADLSSSEIEVIPAFKARSLGFERIEPNFLCRPLITRDEVQKEAVSELINKIFSGSAEKLFASLIGGNSLSKEEIDSLKRIVKDLDGD